MKALLLTIFVLVPGISFASISVNEIMYDLEGTDSDREWLELVNKGPEFVNISNWKFYENSSNHGLTLYSGEEILAPGEFAVIVDSPEVFLSDWPSFTGNLFDSSWSSFSNTGETFAIKNEDGDIVDEVTYSPEDGANGDGKSLQLISDEFTPASPTPGKENQGVEQETNTAISNTQSGEIAEVEYVSTFGIPDRVVSGEKIFFDPKLYDNEGNLIFKALFQWSLGDGNAREDDYRKDFSHVYEHPGVYVVYVEVYTSSRRHDPDHVYRQTIKVLPANIDLAILDEGVSLKNKSVYELDIGNWDLLLDSNDKFRIPKNTIILPGKEIIFSFPTLGVNFISDLILQNESDDMVSSILNSKLEKDIPKKKIIYIPTIKTTAPVQKVVEEVLDISDVEPQIASALSALPEVRKNKSLWFWIYGLLIVSVIGIISYIYLKEEDDFLEELNEADEYTIE
ncbi:MAG: hypothetical protein ACI88L_000243 [Candidatus Paceibacteria bacterium]|jgi:hypothetical protein